LRYLLDTGLLIHHLRGQKNTVQLLRSLAKSNRLCISTVTRLEVRAGAHPDEQVITQKLLSHFMNLDIDARIADKAGELVAHGKQSNQPILVPDAVIAATALVHSITLITFNARDFKHIPKLSLHPLSS
jgi:tRNA(fMet)-specific endonuclease VapC